MHFSNLDDNVLRQIILDHYNNPNNKNLDKNKEKNYCVYNANNASCIDDITVAIKFNKGKIEDACFNGVACAICTSSTDIFCDLLKTKTISEAKNIINNYKKLILNEKYDANLLKESIAFKNIYRQISRIGCATIGINALESIINDYENKK